MIAGWENQYILAEPCTGSTYLHVGTFRYNYRGSTESVALDSTLGLFTPTSLYLQCSRYLGKLDGSAYVIMASITNYKQVNISRQ